MLGCVVETQSQVRFLPLGIPGLPGASCGRGGQTPRGWETMPGLMGLAMMWSRLSKRKTLTRLFYLSLYGGFVYFLEGSLILLCT